MEAVANFSVPLVVETGIAKTGLMRIRRKYEQRLPRIWEDIHLAAKALALS